MQVFVNLTTSRDDQSYAHKRGVINFVIHQAFNTSDIYLLSNDIALLFLDSPVTGVTPIQLNTPEVGIPTDGQVLKAIGLGVIDSNQTDFPDDLLEVDLPKVNEGSCNGSYFQFDDSMVNPTAWRLR
jgi:hypothetical protein